LAFQFSQAAAGVIQIALMMPSNEGFSSIQTAQLQLLSFRLASLPHRTTLVGDVASSPTDKQPEAVSTPLLSGERVNMLLLTCFVLLGLLTWASWKVSAYDSLWIPQPPERRFAGRIVKCAITFPFLAFILWAIYERNPSVLLLPIALILALLWAGSASSMLAAHFQRFIFSQSSQDDEEFNPQQSRENLDRLASLIQQGKKEEAIRLCEELKASGDASVLAMETMLARLNTPPETPSSSVPKEGDTIESLLVPGKNTTPANSGSKSPSGY
jgi:hypothetical protein